MFSLLQIYSSFEGKQVNLSKLANELKIILSFLFLKNLCQAVCTLTRYLWGKIRRLMLRLDKIRRIELNGTSNFVAQKTSLTVSNFHVEFLLVYHP